MLTCGLSGSCPGRWPRRDKRSASYEAAAGVRSSSVSVPLEWRYSRLLQLLWFLWEVVLIRAVCRPVQSWWSPCLQSSLEISTGISMSHTSRWRHSTPFTVLSGKWSLLQRSTLFSVLSGKWSLLRRSTLFPKHRLLDP